MRHHDAIGIGLSGLCLVHCLALPVLISLSPALVLFENEWTHLALAGMALPVSLLAMRNWVGGARAAGLRAMATFGVGLLFYAALGEMSELAEQGVTTVGALLLATSHVLAWVSARTCGTHQD
ncbi:MerC domain-containing protein [Maricaulis sp.]|uniref:MerC domain-containing protein n=1 Tax=Maricaulis sp. TaxID=1486257 RepID=UPI0025E31224|nr:MerC domain-containing protein [Maricaulis sp.]MDF1768585.1 MerC domain-containing protein [Maricaulis sp.]